EALEAAEIRLTPLRSEITIILLRTDFGKLDIALNRIEGLPEACLDGALFDLGVSSHQLDTPRGFSFRRDERLDMRMGATSGPTAADLLATVDEAELRRILSEYGEERWAGRIARSLIQSRDRGERIVTTSQLTALVEQSIPRAVWPRDIHVATRTFQALRIA